MMLNVPLTVEKKRGIKAFIIIYALFLGLSRHFEYRLLSLFCLYFSTSELLKFSSRPNKFYLF